MTYLHHLAARTLNQLPVVQPRLPSRFESARHAHQSAPIEHAAFTASAPSIISGAASFTPTPLTEAPRATGSDSPIIHTMAESSRSTWEAASINPTLVQAAEVRRAGETDRGVQLPPATVVSSNTLTREIDRTVETISDNTLSERTTTIEQRTMIERERLASPAPVTPVAAPRSSRLVPRVEVRAVQTSAPAPAAPVAAPESPVIHVSIGRVEVRAVQTSAPAPAAPKHKIISLDDYLHGVRT